MLREIHEEVKQLRAAAQVYAALLERVLAEDPEVRTSRLAAREMAAHLKEAS